MPAGDGDSSAAAFAYELAFDVGVCIAATAEVVGQDDPMDPMTAVRAERTWAQLIEPAARRLAAHTRRQVELWLDSYAEPIAPLNQAISQLAESHRFGIMARSGLVEGHVAALIGKTYEDDEAWRKAVAAGPLALGETTNIARTETTAARNGALDFVLRVVG